MKTKFALPLLLVTATAAFAANETPATSVAVPAPAAPVVPAPAVNFDDLKTADEFYNHVQKVRRTPPLERTQDGMVKHIQMIVTAQDEFAKRFPEDERSWESRAESANYRIMLHSRLKVGTAADAETAKKDLQAVVSSEKAPAAVRERVAWQSLNVQLGELDPDTEDGLKKAIGALDDFAQKYPKAQMAANVGLLKVRVLSNSKLPAAEAQIKALAESGDEKSKSAAQELLKTKAKEAELKTKPLDLKFKAADGTDFDISKWRGKVVLVDFWASWCGPCIVEAPNVVAAFKKYQPKGFEIVGISLDQDKAKMEEAVKKHGLSWPHHFDGKGWQNEISSGYGIRSIPATWLLDKKGMVREIGARGEALAPAIEKLLAE